MFLNKRKTQLPKPGRKGNKSFSVCKVTNDATVRDLTITTSQFNHSSAPEDLREFCINLSFYY